MRHKTNEFLKRLQLARPEVKKNFRRGGTNVVGISYRFFLINFLFYFLFLGDGPAGME